MKKPDELEDLLVSLAEQSLKSNVVTEADTQALVHIGKHTITLDRQDCELLFSTDESAQEFIDSLGEIGGAYLELVSLDVPEDVKAILERNFSAVEER